MSKIFKAEAIRFAGYTESGPAWFVEWGWETVGFFSSHEEAKRQAYRQCAANLGKTNHEYNRGTPWRVTEIDVQ
jgi:hypothetical protein